MLDRTIHPCSPRTAPGVVDVWRANLASVGPGAMRLLSPAERKRAAGIAVEARRELWMRGRGVLRALLGSYVERPGDVLELIAGARGKLALAPAPDGRAPGSPPAVSFNLSHSGTWALYAFTSEAPVGIDLEVARRRKIDVAALAMRVFGPQEVRRLQALPSSSARETEFLRLWVAHEAKLKCLGLALIGTAEATPDAATQLWLAELDLGPDMAAAVAVQGGPQELRLWDYPTPGLPPRAL
jgi:4'-phosphopantetheinyl transferase